MSGWVLSDSHQGQIKLRRASGVMTQTRWLHWHDLWEKKECGLRLPLSHLSTEEDVEMHQLMPVCEI